MIEKFKSVDELEEVLSAPGEELISQFAQLEGDIMFLGVSGKMGISMARMAKKALEASGNTKVKVIGVSRFSQPANQQLLESSGIKTIKGDLLDQNFVSQLPLAPNIYFLAGHKFGTEENESYTWAMNAYLPGLVANHFNDSRIVALSTGCVYPLVPVTSSGSRENGSVDPVGEYAQSCLGRERLFEFGSKAYGTHCILIRLNYAVEMRYGVLVDIASKIIEGKPIDLTMGHANVIWQREANDMILRSIGFTQSPAAKLNIAGPEIFSVREVAEKMGTLMDVESIFTGTEGTTALLSDGSAAYEMLGRPKIGLDKILGWTASWIKNNGMTLGKATHFEVRDGKY